jgi:hypothetical protein
MGIIDGLIDSVTGGAGSIVQGIIGGLFADEAQQDTNEANWQVMKNQQAFSAEQAGRAMDFAAQQSDTKRWWDKGEADTAWQRTVKDMQNAGLSPMLAYSQGPNPTIPSSAASGTAGSPPSSPHMISGKQAGFQAALQTAAAVASIDKTRSEAEVNRASIPKIGQDVRTGEAQEQQLRQATRNAQYQLENILPAEQAKLVAEAAVRVAEAGTEEQRPRLVSHQADVEFIRYKDFEQRIKSELQRQHLTAAQEAEIQLKLPGLYNQMRIDLTTYGQNIRPFINDARGAAGAANIIRRR